MLDLIVLFRIEFLESLKIRQKIKRELICNF